MGYTKEVIKGVSWIGGYRVLTRVIAFARIAILARILVPAQFGAVGIALLVMSFVEIVTETGINVFLVQEDKKIDSFVNTAWVVSIVRGIIIAGVMIVSAPFIASFFNSPESLFLLLLLSLVPLIRGFINPSIVLFQKELHFNKEFYLRSVLFFVDAFIAITTALIFQNPASIIYGIIGAGVLEVILSFMIVKPLPSFSYNSEHLRLVLSRGKWVTSTSVFSYLFQNIDDMVVGKLSGTTALGLYDVAYRISMLPITEAADVISKVTFPLYVKISGDSKRLQKAFVKTLGATSIIVIPIGIILALFPEFIISILLGDKWLEAAPVLRVLAIVGVVRSLVGSTTALFFAVKKQEYASHVTLAGALGLGIFIVPFVLSFGIVGAAYASFIGLIVSIPFAVYYSAKVLSAP